MILEIFDSNFAHITYKKYFDFTNLLFNLKPLIRLSILYELNHHFPKLLQDQMLIQIFLINNVQLVHNHYK